MFLEEEIYYMLKWGFYSVISIQLLFVIRLWFLQKFDTGSYIYMIFHIIFFSLAGFNLLSAIDTFEYKTGMGSEEASLDMVFAGILWSVSVMFLLLSISRLVRKTN